MRLQVEFNANGRKGPARTQDEADAALAASRALIDQKRARLAELQARLEAEGHPPARARALAAVRYHEEG